MIHSYCGDLTSAERHYQRAIALNPNDANAIAGSGKSQSPAISLRPSPAF